MTLSLWSRNLYASAETCNPGQLTTCSKPLSLLNDPGFAFVPNKTVLDTICPDLNKAISCVTAFSRRCMDEDRRRHFWRLFHGTRSMVDELCRNGTFREEYLLQVPCMSKVREENGMCFRNYSRKIQEVSSRSRNASEGSDGMETGIIGNVCCAFHSYVECSTATIRRTCDEASAAFNRRFLYKISSSMLQSHCLHHGRRECGLILASTSTAHRRCFVMIVLLLSLNGVVFS